MGRCPPDGWFILENRIKIDDLGGTPILGNLHIVEVDTLLLRSGYNSWITQKLVYSQLYRRGYIKKKYQNRMM